MVIETKGAIAFKERRRLLGPTTAAAASGWVLVGGPLGRALPLGHVARVVVVVRVAGRRVAVLGPAVRAMDGGEAAAAVATAATAAAAAAKVAAALVVAAAAAVAAIVAVALAAVAAPVALLILERCGAKARRGSSPSGRGDTGWANAKPTKHSHHARRPSRSRRRHNRRGRGRDRHGRQSRRGRHRRSLLRLRVDRGSPPPMHYARPIIPLTAVVTGATAGGGRPQLVLAVGEVALVAEAALAVLPPLHSQ